MILLFERIGSSHTQKYFCKTEHFGVLLDKYICGPLHSTDTVEAAFCPEKQRGQISVVRLGPLKPEMSDLRRHDPGNVALRPGDIPQLADLASDCWRWIKPSRKADRPTALFPLWVARNQRARRDNTTCPSRTFGCGSQKCVSEHPTCNPLKPITPWSPIDPNYSTTRS
jgi:hypothetical protein